MPESAVPGKKRWMTFAKGESTNPQFIQGIHVDRQGGMGFKDVGWALRQGFGYARSTGTGAQARQPVKTGFMIED